MNDASSGQGQRYLKSADLPYGREPGYGYLYVIAKALTGPCIVGANYQAGWHFSRAQTAPKMDVCV